MDLLRKVKAVMNLKEIERGQIRFTEFVNASSEIKFYSDTNGARLSIT